MARGILPELWYGSCALEHLPPSHLSPVHAGNPRPAASVNQQGDRDRQSDSPFFVFFRIINSAASYIVASSPNTTKHHVSALFLEALYYRTNQYDNCKKKKHEVNNKEVSFGSLVKHKLSCSTVPKNHTHTDTHTHKEVVPPPKQSDTKPQTKNHPHRGRRKQINRDCLGRRQEDEDAEHN